MPTSARSAEYGHRKTANPAVPNTQNLMPGCSPTTHQAPSLGFWPIHVHAKFCEKRRKRKRKEGGKKGVGKERKFIWIRVATNLAIVDLYWCLICFILLMILWLKSYSHCFSYRRSSCKIISNCYAYCLWSNVFRGWLLHYIKRISQLLCWRRFSWRTKEHRLVNTTPLEMHVVDSPLFSSNALFLHFKMGMKISPIIPLQYIFFLLWSSQWPDSFLSIRWCTPSAAP